MQYTENRSMYVVDYEERSSTIREFMSGKDLRNLRKREQNGSVRITNLICLSDSARK